MQHNDLDALIRKISQQCGDPAAAARLKARMQNPEQQRAARSMFRQHGASLERAMHAGRRHGRRQANPTAHDADTGGRTARAANRPSDGTVSLFGTR